MRARLIAGAVLLLALGCTGGGGGGGKSSSSGSTIAPATSRTPPAPVGSTTPPRTPPATPPVTPPAPSTSGGSGGITGVTPGTPAYGLSLNASAASKYSIYIPRGYAGSPVGLVLALHGVEGSANPNGWFQLCALICNNDRFIIVSPYGDVNDGGSGAWTQPFAAEILDLVRSKYNVDLKRQYMAAISGGCLPAIHFALGDSPKTYRTVFGGYTAKGGFQRDFAAVGFCAPAYGPSDPDFAATQSLDATALGFTPSFWADYGELSRDKPRADDLAAFGTAKGYSPVKNVVRPGEGHAPSSPYSFSMQMFAQFEATRKP